MHYSNRYNTDIHLTDLKRGQRILRLNSNDNRYNKTNETPVAGSGDGDLTELLEKSKAMQKHVEAFKAKMEYYRDNPGVKSISKKYVVDAIDDWEATLNYSYCDSYIDVNEISNFDTIIPIPIDADLKMEMNDVSERYYNAILYAVQNRYYTYPPFTNQALLAVDLEPNSTYDSVYVSISIGNTMYNSHPPYDWVFGELGGTCGDNCGLHMGESDAAQEAAKYVRAVFNEDPPAGSYWYFTGLVTINATPLETNQNGDYIYDNPDDNTIDNYMDFIIYYASQNTSPGLTNKVRCVEYSPELTFYKLKYKELTQGWINDNSEKKFNLCDYKGKDFGSYLRHELNTILGDRNLRSDIHGNLPLPD